MTDKLATFRVNDDEWEAFKEAAKQDGSNASAELIRFIRAYQNGFRLDREESPAKIENSIESAIAPLVQRIEALEGKLAA